MTARDLEPVFVLWRVNYNRDGEFVGALPISVYDSLERAKQIATIQDKSSKYIVVRCNPEALVFDPAKVTE